MVSILVPVYNSAKYLQQCVQSLTEQTYSDLQIVLIDDGSTDESWAIMRELASSDKRIEVYSQPNMGVAATRNHLLDKIRGDFVLFVDSDDWIDNNTIEILLNKQQEGDYDIVGFQMKGTLVADENQYNQEQIIKLFLEHIVFTGSLCNKFVKSHLYDNLKLDKLTPRGKYTFAADSKWNLDGKNGDFQFLGWKYEQTGEVYQIAAHFSRWSPQNCETAEWTIVGIGRSGGI